MTDITSANSVFTLTIPGIYSIPQTLVDYAADSLFDFEPYEQVELQMGATGTLVGGIVFAQKTQNVHLLASSPSVKIFETWAATQTAQVQTFQASGTILTPSLGKSATMQNGFFKMNKPLPDAKKVFQPITFQIVWGVVTVQSTS